MGLVVQPNRRPHQHLCTTANSRQTYTLVRTSQSASIELDEPQNPGPPAK